MIKHFDIMKNKIHELFNGVINGVTTIKQLFLLYATLIPQHMIVCQSHSLVVLFIFSSFCILTIDVKILSK